MNLLCTSGVDKGLNFFLLAEECSERSRCNFDDNHGEGGKAIIESKKGRARPVIYCDVTHYRKIMNRSVDVYYSERRRT